MRESPFPFINEDKAMAAFQQFVIPGIHQAMSEKLVNRMHLHTVALWPDMPYDPKADLPILLEHSIGDPKEWEWPYNEYARGKAQISWRTGLSSRDVVLTKPHLLIPGDTRLFGSAVLDGIIVACSGVEPYYDEMFATMTAAAIRGIASHYAAQATAMGDDAPDFIPLEQLVVGNGRPTTKLRLEGSPTGV